MSRKRGKNYNRFWGAEGFYDKLSGLNPDPCTSVGRHPTFAAYASCAPYAAASAIKIRSTRGERKSESVYNNMTVGMCVREREE